ncbi:MAG: hypothetical protein KIT31_28345 [Deltaproteobacteria bacterium]|nr:hypothetical protein [Deltaproteobacteria bacterium]
MTSYARRHHQRERRIGALPRDGELIIPVNRPIQGIALAGGLVFALLAVALASDGPYEMWKVALVALLPGAFLIAISVRPVLSSSPLLRADDDGLELGHCEKMPWSEVRAVYPELRTIGLQVERRRAFQHLPLGMWLRARVTGSVHLTVSGGDSAAVVASRLDAMRTRARGVDEHGRVLETEDLPSARVVR